MTTTERPRQTGRTPSQEAAAALVKENEQPTTTELPEERETGFQRAGMARLKTDWDGPDGYIMKSVHEKVDEIISDAFSDLYSMLFEIYNVVREPVYVAGVLQRDEHGLAKWRRDAVGNYVEDWSKMTVTERERFIYMIVTHSFDWRERADMLWAESMFAKTKWEEAFAEGWHESKEPGRGTDAGKTEAAKRYSFEERYHAVYRTYLSRRAESVVRDVEVLGQRLKDLHTNGR